LAQVAREDDAGMKLSMQMGNNFENLLTFPYPRTIISISSSMLYLIFTFISNCTSYYTLRDVITTKETAPVIGDRRVSSVKKKVY
jgi:hypothetical protein